MPITSWKYSRRISPFSEDWISGEWTADPNKSAIDEWLSLVQTVELAISQSDSMKGTSTSPSIPETQVERTSKDKAIDAQIEAISGCTSLKSLEIFRKLVEREQNQRLTEAFESKLKELQ